MLFFLFSFFKFSTFAFNKLESSPPANSGLFNLTSSPFEIQFSDQIQSKHSLGCFYLLIKNVLVFEFKCLRVLSLSSKKGNFISNLQKTNFLLEFEFLSFVCYKLYSCEAKRLFLLLWWTIYQIFVTKCIWAKNPIICPSQSSPFLLYDTQMHKMTWNIFL